MTAYTHPYRYVFATRRPSGPVHLSDDGRFTLCNVCKRCEREAPSRREKTP